MKRKQAESPVPGPRAQDLRNVNSVTGWLIRKQVKDPKRTELLKLNLTGARVVRPWKVIACYASPLTAETKEPTLVFLN